MYRNTERHEMELVDTYPDGAEEWFCPVCYRRFILQWPPNYKRVILEAGDENAVHSGGKNGARMETDRGGLQTGRSHEYEDEYDGNPGLSPIFLAAIDELDFSPLFDNMDGGSEGAS